MPKFSKPALLVILLLIPSWLIVLLVLHIVRLNATMISLMNSAPRRVAHMIVPEAMAPSKQPGADISGSSTSLTAGWQTYRNLKYGFEVKYPGNWSVPDLYPGQDIEAVFSVYEDANFPTEPGSEAPLTLDMHVYNTMSYQEVKIVDYYADAKGKVVEPQIKKVSYGDGSSNEEIYKYGGPEGTEYVLHWLKFNKGDQTYVFTFNYAIAGCDVMAESFKKDCFTRMDDFAKKHETMIDQILSTFRFISAADTSNWLTYRTSAYEFKYPSNYAIFIPEFVGNDFSGGPTLRTVSPASNPKNNPERIYVGRSTYDGKNFSLAPIQISSGLVHQDQDTIDKKEIYYMTVWQKSATAKARFQRVTLGNKEGFQVDFRGQKWIDVIAGSEDYSVAIYETDTRPKEELSTSEEIIASVKFF